MATTDEVKPGTQGCTGVGGHDCKRQVLIVGTPTVWWGGTVVLLAAVVLWIGTRDWRFGVAVVGVGATWLPWFLYDDRPIFLFYAVAIVPFLVLALVLCLGRLMGPDREPSPRRTAGVIVGGAFLVLTILNFAWLWPILTYEVLEYAEWRQRIWFSRWI